MSDLDPVLAGTRILVTSQRRSPELAGALERRGATVRIASVLGVEQGINEAEIVDLSRRLVADGADTVVVTTAIGFRGWCDAAEAAGQTGADGGRPRMCVRDLGVIHRSYSQLG